MKILNTTFSIVGWCIAKLRKMVMTPVKRLRMRMRNLQLRRAARGRKTMVVRMEMIIMD